MKTEPTAISRTSITAAGEYGERNISALHVPRSRATIARVYREIAPPADLADARGVRVDERLARRRDLPRRVRGHRVARRRAGRRRPGHRARWRPAFRWACRCSACGSGSARPAPRWGCRPRSCSTRAACRSPSCGARSARSGWRPAGSRRCVEVVREHLAAPLDPLARAAALGLARPGARVADLAVALGLSERQLRRRFVDAVGYGPKTLARVLRFQRFLALAGARRRSRAARVRGGLRGPGAPDARVPAVVGAHAGRARRLGRGRRRRAPAAWLPERTAPVRAAVRSTPAASAQAQRARSS